MMNLGVNFLEAWEGASKGSWEGGSRWEGASKWEGWEGKSKEAKAGPEQWEALPCPREGRHFRHLQN